MNNEAADNNSKAGSADFRKWLRKVLPGYNWTVHKSKFPDLQTAIHATGVQTSGFNRTSTIEVVMKKQGQWFEAYISGYGKHSTVLGEGFGRTVAQAFRALQSNLETKAQIYAVQAGTVQAARLSPNT